MPASARLCWMTNPLSQDVEAAFAAYDAELRQQLLDCRDLVFQVAAENSNIGPITETLKWGQPSYLTATTGAGTTPRLAASSDGQPTLFVHCGTDLIE